MVERSQYYPSLGVWLRLPGILLMELIITENISSESLLGSGTNDEESTYIDQLVHTILTFLLYIIALALVLLPVKMLKSIHTHILWLICVASSNYVTILFCEEKYVSKPKTNSVKCIWGVCNYFDDTFYILAQITLCLTSCWIINCKSLLQLIICFFPMFAWIFFSGNGEDPNEEMYICISASLSLAVYYFIFKFLSGNAMMQIIIKFSLLKHLLGWRGIVSLALSEYELPDLFMWAWITKVLAQIVFNLWQPMKEIIDLSKSARIGIICFISMVQCTATFLSLIGLVVFISRIIKLQFYLVRSWLNGSFTNHVPDPVDVGSASFIDGLTMMIMSIYVQVAELDIYSRAIFMIYIFLTIFSSQVRTIYTMVDAFLLTLATVQNASLYKHLRTCCLALFLISMCAICSYCVVTYFGTDNMFWTVVITHNFIATIALTVGSLLIYIFMLIDSKMIVSIANIDDVVFYVRGFSEFFEFILTILVSLFVMSSLYNDVRGIPGTILLAFYNYYNLMTKGKSGWRTWKMRREAGDKVKSLHEASMEEKAKMDDVCSICYQELNAASSLVTVRIMHCKHAFHEGCLKKWFQIQDKCPICHKDFNAKEELPGPQTVEIKETNNAPKQNDLVEESSDIDTEEQTISDYDSPSSEATTST